MGCFRNGLSTSTEVYFMENYVSSDLPDGGQHTARVCMIGVWA